MPYEKQTTKEELKKMKLSCYTSNCKRKAWLQDWTGYKYCFKDWYRSLRWGSGENCKWFFIKTTKIF